MTSAAPSSNPVLAQAWRGGIVESAHRGALAIVDAAGAVHTALGDIQRPIFPRSAIKVLQALPLVASGAAEQLQLTDEELSLACASHGGDAIHVSTAASMLAKAGIDVGALECGAHWPYNETASRDLVRQGQALGLLTPGGEGYWLTPRGLDLYGVLVAIQHWADHWLAARLRAPIRLVHRGCGAAFLPAAFLPIEPGAHASALAVSVNHAMR